MMEESRGIDDILTLKLAIEPTEATRQSLNELSGLADEILETIVKASEAFDSTQEQRQLLRKTLMDVNADESYENMQRELDESRQTMRETLDSVSSRKLDSTPDTTIDPDLQASPITRDMAIDRAQSYSSLHARGLDADFQDVENIANNGGVESVLSNALERENGGIVDQLSIATSRIGQSISESISGATKNVTPKFADTLNSLPDSAIDRLVASMEETAESTKKLADKSDRDDLAEQGVGVTPEVDKPSTEGTAQPPQPEAPPKPAPAPKPPRAPKPPPSDEDRRFTAGQQIEELLGVKGRNSAVSNLQSRANRITEWGDKLTGISETLSGPEEVILDENGNPLASAAQTAGLLRAGSRVAGSAGLGEVGGKISKFGKGVVGAASRFAVPLAVGAAAYSAIDRGTDAYYETSELGYAQGETGFDAFTTGFMDNASDTLSGWNPFTPEDSRTLRRYRETAINNSIGIAPDSDGVDALIDAQKEFGRRGLRPEQAIQLFGQEIFDDSDFDVAEALDELAEGAKEAGVSLQNFVDTATTVTDQLEGRFGYTDTEHSEEIAGMLNSGIFDAEEGHFGMLDDREKSGILSRAMDHQSALGMRIINTVRQDDDLVSRMEEDGIDTTDFLAVSEWLWSGNMSPEQLNNLIHEAGTRGIPEDANLTEMSSYMQSVYGATPSTDRLRMVPDADGDISGSDGSRLSSIVLNSASSAFGSSRGPAAGQGGEINLNINLSDGLVADISTTQDMNNVATGNTDYGERSQTGRTGPNTNHTTYHNVYSGG